MYVVILALSCVLVKQMLRIEKTEYYSSLSLFRLSSILRILCFEQKPQLTSMADPGVYQNAWKRAINNAL